MSAYDQYLAASRALGELRQWANMLGAEYHGGGGGVGDVAKSSTCSLTLYYQESNGSRNYHEAPRSADRWIALGFLDVAPHVIGKALLHAEREVAQLAASAAKEATAVLEAVKQ